MLAGLSKISARDRFEQAVIQYEVLPVRFAQAVAMWLPLLEIAAGVSLALGLATNFTAWVLSAALTAFAAVIGINLLRGRTFDCGCFSLSRRSDISWPHVGGNLLLGVAALSVALRPPATLSLDAAFSSPSAEPLTGTDGTAVLVSVTLVILTYALTGQSARLRHAMGTLSHPGEHEPLR